MKLVIAPRVPRTGNLSIFSRTVNGEETDADNQHGHPWGRERESAKMTGLRLSPPNRGLRELSHLRTGGHGSFPDLARVGPVNDDRDGGVGDRTWSSIGRTDPSGDCQLIPTRSRRRPTTSLFTEDIAMTSAVLVLALSLPGQSSQAYPAAQAPAKVAPAPQAPAKVAPAPQAPSKIAPAPCAPSKVAPAPQAAAPYAPSKIAPAPQAAAPYAPSKVAPAPQAAAPYAPSKIAPAPYAPSKVAPAPQAGAPYVPSKIAPAPQAPAKVAPAPQAAAPYAPAKAVPQS